jgi:hypothetical protein
MIGCSKPRDEADARTKFSPRQLARTTGSSTRRQTCAKNRTKPCIRKRCKLWHWTQKVCVLEAARTGGTRNVVQPQKSSSLIIPADVKPAYSGTAQLMRRPLSSIARHCVGSWKPTGRSFTW